MIHRTGEYALRGVIWLAAHPGQSLTAQELAAGTQTPPGYMAKVLQCLSKAGLLSSRRGLHGGFALLGSPKGFTLWDVLQAVDPIRRRDGTANDVDELRALHRTLDAAMHAIEHNFANCRISDLLGRANGATPLCVSNPVGPRRLGKTLRVRGGDPALDPTLPRWERARLAARRPHADRPNKPLRRGHSTA